MGNIPDEELIEMSEHLHYEIQMLVDTSRTLALLGVNELNGPILQTIRNALVESFAIHTRVLLDFLNSKQTYDTDMIADHYFDDPMEWKKARPKNTPLLESVHSRVGKEIAHLSYNRLKDEYANKEWSTKIAKDVVVTLDKFVCVVPSKRISPSFSEYINRLSKSDFWADV